MSSCHYCGREGGLRPYGPGGAPVCFPCGTATPERERQAEQAFDALLHAAEASSPEGVVAIGDEDGPKPYSGGAS